MPEVCRDSASMTVRFSLYPIIHLFHCIHARRLTPALLQVRTCAYAGTGNVVHIQELMHVCAEHRDATSEKKEANAASAGAAASGPPLLTRQPHLLSCSSAPPADIYSAWGWGLRLLLLPASAADDCHLGGSAEQAVAAIGLVAAVSGRRSRRRNGSLAVDGMLQVFNPRHFCLSGLQSPPFLVLCCMYVMTLFFPRSLATLLSAALSRWLWPCSSVSNPKPEVLESLSRLAHDRDEVTAFQAILSA